MVAQANALPLLWSLMALREVLGGYLVPFVGHHVSLSKQERIESSLETINVSSLICSFPLAVLQLRQLLGVLCLLFLQGFT